MRILLWVRAGNKFGSMEKYIFQVADQSKNRGHELVILNEIENSSEEYRALLKLHNTKQIIVGESEKYLLHINHSALQFIRKWRPDVVQLYFVNSLVIPLIKILGTPVVYQTYLSGIDHKIRLQTKILRKFDNIFASRVIAVSNRVRKDEIRAGISSNHIQTLYMGINLQEYENINSNLDGHTPIGWYDNNQKKIISVGRFFPEKGMRFVVEAAIKVLTERNDVVWWFVGQNGPESDYCNRVIHESHLSNRIEMLGLVRDVLPLIKASYVQVVGSLSEGLPFVPLESAACGVPTIGTNIGGMDEAIINGATGLLVDRCSSDRLADAVKLLLDNPQLRDEMGRASKKHIEEKFDSKQLISRLLDLFEEDLKNMHINNH